MHGTNHLIVRDCVCYRSVGNGIYLEDDVIDISERAVGGALVGHSLPLGDGVDGNDVANFTSFPYEPDPFSGFDNTKGKDFPKTG